MKKATKAKSRAPKTAKPKAGKKPVKSGKKRAAPSKAKTTKAAPPKPPAAKEKAAPAAPKSEVGGKLGIILEMVKRPKGATIEEMAKATDWQNHSVRSAITHQLRKLRGFAIETQKTKGEVTVYKL